MKKIYENIEQIHIKGDISQLSEIVTVMDKELQNIAYSTDVIAGDMIKYSASNKGSQFEKAVRTALVLRKEVIKASRELNEMQHQIVKYQNKIYRYEDLAQRASSPNPFCINERTITPNNNTMQFNKTEMISFAGKLDKYHDIVLQGIRRIQQKKQSAGSIWQDNQYTVFSSFVDDVSKKIIEALKEFSEYVRYLKEKIKELD